MENKNCILNGGDYFTFQYGSTLIQNKNCILKGEHYFTFQYGSTLI